MSQAPKPTPDMEIIASDEGFVVHDADRNVIHYLNQTAAVVLSLCDGERTVDEIASLLQRQFGLAEPPRADVAAAVVALREQGVVV